MSAEDDQSHNDLEDGGAAGPGAPTPLTSLEVSRLLLTRRVTYTKCLIGRRWSDETRHPARDRWRLPHSRECRIYVSLAMPWFCRCTRN